MLVALRKVAGAHAYVVAGEVKEYIVPLAGCVAFASFGVTVLDVPLLCVMLRKFVALVVQPQEERPVASTPMVP